MRPRTGVAAFATLMTTAGVLAAAAAGATAAHASTTASGPGRPAGFGSGHGQTTRLIPGDLLVSTSYYQNDPGIVAGTTQLPPGCTGANCVTAIADGKFAMVPIPDPKLGPRKVDIASMYNTERYRPTYTSKEGLPVFLTHA